MKGIFLVIGVIIIPLMSVVGQSNNVSLGIFFQPGISYQFTSYKDQDTKDLLEDLHKGETPNIGWEGGILVNYHMSDYIHFESGITLSKKGFRKVSYYDSLIFREPEYPIYSGIEKSISNHEFYFLSSSLRAGFTVYQTRNFAAGVLTGIIFDYHLISTIRYERIYKDHTENAVEHPEYAYLRKFNISGSLSLYAKYRFSDQYHIGLEPYCSINILPSFKDSQAESRFLLCGVRASLFYYF